MHLETIGYKQHHMCYAANYYKIKK